MPLSSAPSTHSSPTGWGTTVGTDSQPVFPGNASSGGAIFCNAGPTTLAICPALVTVGDMGIYPAGPSPSVAAIGAPGCISLAPGEKLIIDTLLCTAPWNGVSDADGGVITILVF